MSKRFVAGLTLVAAVSFASATGAEVLYRNVVSGTYGQASGYFGDEFAGISVSVDGSDEATLATYSNSSAEGYKFWYGKIPASLVTVKGVNSIAVRVDTCAVDASAGCGYVDVAFKTDPKGGGFITDGSQHYTWDNVIVQVAGPTQVHVANATGFVNGVSVDAARAFIGKYTQVSIEVLTGN